MALHSRIFNPTAIISRPYRRQTITVVQRVKGEQSQQPLPLPTEPHVDAMGKPR